MKYFFRKRNLTDTYSGRINEQIMFEVDAMHSNGYVVPTGWRLIPLKQDVKYGLDTKLAGEVTWHLAHQDLFTRNLYIVYRDGVLKQTALFERATNAMEKVVREAFNVPIRD